jgi:hypothetical protein
VSEQSPRTKKAATAQNGECIQTNAASDQQLPTAPNGVTTGNAPVAAGAEASTTQSQSIAATPDQPKKPSQAGLKIEGMTSIKLGNSELLYAESWLPDADQWFERLKSEVPWSPQRVNDVHLS